MYATISRRRPPSPFAGGGEATLGGLDHAHAVERARDPRRVVGGAIRNDDHLVAGIPQTVNALKAFREGRRAVVGADRDGHLGRMAGALDRRCRKCLAYGGQRALRRALARREAEVPVEDLVSAAVPRVRPGEHERACAPGRVTGLELPAQRSRLLLLAVAATVEADLRHQQWPVIGEVLQATEVGLEILPALEIDVEREEVEARQAQILRRGVVDVGDQCTRVLIPRSAAQASKEAFD